MSKPKLGEIENELKYVLDLRGLETIELEAEHILKIKQGYLFKTIGQTARIRETTYPKGEKHYEFTFKQKISHGVAVELDNSITKITFDRLTKHSNSWVIKTRMVIDGWDIDCFKDDDKPYFLMAECELNENQKFPDTIPSIIREFLVYEVERGDSRFSSRKIGDIKYAKKLLNKLALTIH